METSLRENEGRLRTIVDTAPDPVIVIDENGIIETFSRAAEAQFGYTAEEAIGRNVSILMPPPHCDNHDSYIRRYVETGEAHIIGIGRELTGRRKDGTLFPLRLAVGESTVGGRRIFTGFAHDMTEREQVRRRVQELQAELLHVSRMSDMGEMASGLAHELNQPLTAVMNYVNASRRLLRASRIDKTDGTGDAEAQRARIAALLDKAVGQTERAGKTIRHLREFVRHGVGERAGEDINAVVEEACAFALVGFTDAGIKLDLDLQEDLPPAFVDKIQVQQVVLNLVRNAAEAMAEAPRRALRITTRACARETIVVTITDSGPGLAPEILPRLFQPFVTTKPQGMGVGLSICRSIIEAHGGRISARTPEGGGTEFRFTLSSAIDGGESEDG